MIYVMVHAGSDDPHGSTTATLLDPSFPSSLGSDARETMLIDLNVKIELVGGNVAKLCPGSACVMYGSAAQVMLVTTQARIRVGCTSCTLIRSETAPHFSENASEGGPTSSEPAHQLSTNCAHTKSYAS